MYNCNFEAISLVLNKTFEKIEMEYEPLICTIIFYLMLCIKLGKSFLC